ncbi:MAG: DUF1684 domain-containing protein [Acidobacteria bacterium]|nr:DUF1684 domain-containing protein [Acidobacteriota bacterium]
MTRHARLAAPLALSFLTAMLLGTTVLITGCSRKTSPNADPQFLAEEQAWRAHRLESLTSEDGWLTLVGLFWLEPGRNDFGSDLSNSVVIPETAGHAGRFELATNGTVTIDCNPDAGVTVAGEPVTRRALASDADGAPDVLHAGRISFYLIKRGTRFAIRVKDPQAETRTGFLGLQYFPPDPEYRVKGRLVRFEKPQPVDVPTVVGSTQQMLVPGIVHFTLEGHQLSLKPLVESPKDQELFFVFRDATSGSQTYGAGRFLSAAAPDDNGTVVLDFNRAYNPPCAFTPFATCPLPIPGNDLPIAVRAGEKAYAGGHHK